MSRPTIYRRWPDTRAVVAALLTREIVALVEQVHDRGPARELLVERIVAVAQRLRDHPMFDAILRSRPELLMAYVITRLGMSRPALIDVVEGGIRRGQAHGSVRPGNPQQLATMLLLITQSAIQSARTVEPILRKRLARELALALNGYLAP